LLGSKGSKNALPNVDAAYKKEEGERERTKGKSKFIAFLYSNLIVVLMCVVNLPADSSTNLEP